MRYRHQWAYHAADTDLVQCAAACRRRLAIDESDAHGSLFHEAVRSEVVGATIEVHRAAAHHDRAAPFDLGKCGRVGLHRLAHFDVRIELAIEILSHNSM